MPVTLKRRVVREAAETHRGRPLIILLETGGRLIRIREKGRRQWFTITYRQALYLGAKNETARLKAAKDAQRKEKQRASV